MTITYPCYHVLRRMGVGAALLSMALSAMAADADDALLVATVNTLTPTVQSEVLYTVKLYYRHEIQNAKITEPVVDDALIVRLGTDSEYETVYHHKAYRVIERRYAVYPQHHGNMKILSPLFSGLELVLPAERDSQEMLLTLRAPVAIHKVAEDIMLKVQPVPAVAQHVDWLPAQHVTLSQQWDGLSHLNPGEPITRTIHIHAVGITAEQIPDVTLTATHNISAYREHAVNENHYVNQRIEADRTFNVVYIPKAGGEMIIPPVSLPWWDVNTKQLKRAVLPGKTLMIPGAPLPLQATQQGKPALSRIQGGAQLPHASPVMGAEAIDAVPFWQDSLWQLSGLCCVIVLGTLLIRRVHSRQMRLKRSSQHDNTTAIAAALRAVEMACEGGDMAALSRALIAWGQLRFVQDQVLSLSDVEQRLNDPAFSEQIRQMALWLYDDRQKAPTSPDLSKVWRTFSRCARQLDKTVGVRARTPSGLPPLYPA